MARLRIARWLLMLAIAAGVALGPLTPFLLVAPASAMPVMQHESSHDSSNHDLMDMADGMPCCPTKAPVPADCDKCSLPTCMIKLSGPAPGMILTAMPVLAIKVAPVSDVAPTGLSKPPPDRPPRLLV